jgi:hypothetical protein
VVIVPGATAAAPLEPTVIGRTSNNEKSAAIRAALGTDESIENPPLYAKMIAVNVYSCN